MEGEGDTIRAAQGGVASNSDYFHGATNGMEKENTQAVMNDPKPLLTKCLKAGLARKTKKHDVDIFTDVINLLNALVGFGLCKTLLHDALTAEFFDEHGKDTSLLPTTKNAFTVHI